MEIVQNPQEYDKKVPTNIRLLDNLKALALEDAEKRGVTLSQIVNEALAAHYNVQIEGEQSNVTVDTQSDMG